MAPAELDLTSYIAAILKRFRNPAIRHRLSQIAWDGSQKLSPRLLDTIVDALIAGRPLDRLATPVAAWLRFIAREMDDGTALVDPLANQLTAAMRAGGPEAILAMPEIFGDSLRSNPQFQAPVLTAFAAMADQEGVRNRLR